MTREKKRDNPIIKNMMKIEKESGNPTFKTIMKIGKVSNNPIFVNTMKEGKTLRPGKNKNGQINKSIETQVVERQLKRFKTQGIIKKLVI